MDHHSDSGCPRCGSTRIGGTGARANCGRCGKDWQIGAPAVEPAVTEEERYAARRALDELAEWPPTLMPFYG
jgi:hypothetical protein